MTKVELGSASVPFISSQKGSAILGLISMVGAVIFIPGILLSANENFLNSMNRLSSRERVHSQAEAFTAAVIAGLRSDFSCTENLKAAGLYELPATSLSGRNFPLRLPTEGGTPDLRTQVVQDPNQLGYFLKDIALTATQLQYLEKRSETTSIAKVEFKFRSINSQLPSTDIYDRSLGFLMFLETDLSQRVIRCAFTKVVDSQGLFLEDKICAILKGAGQKFEMKNEVCL
jgi:hypothetical protein